MKTFKISQSITKREGLSTDIFLREIFKRKLLTQEEEKELAIKCRKGDLRARNKLIESNIRFVISIAKQYQRKGVPLMDLIQEGLTGLCTAADKYDPDKGVKFVSYAVWWIRQSIIKCLYDQSRTIRVPISRINSVTHLNKVIDDYEKIKERQPTFEELEKETGVKSDKINSTLNSITNSVSLDSTIKEDLTLGDIIADENSDSTDKHVNDKDLETILSEAVNCLPDREHDIIRLFYGLGIEKMSYFEIGKLFGLTNERVRQLEREALKYLFYKYKDDLKDFL